MWATAFTARAPCRFSNRLQSTPAAADARLAAIPELRTREKKAPLFRRLLLRAQRARSPGNLGSARRAQSSRCRCIRSRCPRPCPGSRAAPRRRGSTGPRSWARRASTFLLLLIGRLAHQLLHPAAHARSELLEVEVGFLDLREHLAFLFLHVMHDVLAEHREGGVEVGIVRAHVLELLDQHLRRLVLDLGLVQEVLVLDRLARRRIEQLLLERRVHLEVLAHGLHELLLRLAVLALELLELLKCLLDLVVLLLQQLDRAAGLRFALRHVRRPFWVD